MIDVGEEKKWVRESERILLGFWDRYVTDFDSRRLDWIDRSVERERYRDDRRKSQMYTLSRRDRSSYV